MEPKQGLHLLYVGFNKTMKFSFVLFVWDMASPSLSYENDQGYATRMMWVKRKLDLFKHEIKQKMEDEGWKPFAKPPPWWLHMGKITSN